MAWDVAGLHDVVSDKQIDVRQFGHIVDKNDIRGAHIAVGETTFVQDLKATGEHGRDLDAFGSRQPLPTPAVSKLVLESFRPVNVRIDVAAGADVIGQFHHVAEVTCFVPLAHMEYPQQIGRFVAEGPIVLKSLQCSLISLVAGVVVRRSDDIPVNEFPCDKVPLSVLRSGEKVNVPVSAASNRL
jgi:hypothetical protein